MFGWLSSVTSNKLCLYCRGRKPRFHLYRMMSSLSILISRSKSSASFIETPSIRRDRLLVFKYCWTMTALFFQGKQTYLLGMYLCALCHTKVSLPMLFLRHQGLSAEESHFQFLQLNLNNDSRVIKCSLSFSVHCHFPLWAARLRDIFTVLNSYRLCSSRGGKKPLCCSDPAGQLWLGSSVFWEGNQQGQQN